MAYNPKPDKTKNAGLLKNKIVSVKNAYEFISSWKKSTGYRPITVTFHLTLNCNLKCKMCEIWRFARDNPKISKGLSKERIFELLDELKVMGTRHVHFSGGECFLRKDFTEILFYASNLDFTISINTNGTFITEDIAQCIVDNRVNNVIFSVDSAIPEIHDEIRGVKGAWEKTIKGIKYLNRAREKSKKDLKISINAVLMKLNFENADELLDLKQQIDFEDIKFLPMVAYYSISIYSTQKINNSFSNLGVGREEIRNFNNSVSPKIKKKAIKYGMKLDIEELAYPFGKAEEVEKFLEHGRSRDFYRENHCFMPFIHIEILPSGDLIPCCIAPVSEDIISLGNVEEKSLKEAWNSQECINFRKKCHFPSIPMCCNCDSTYIKRNKNIMRYFNLLGPFKKILD